MRVVLLGGQRWWGDGGLDVTDALTMKGIGFCFESLERVWKGGNINDLCQIYKGVSYARTLCSSNAGPN